MSERFSLKAKVFKRLPRFTQQGALARAFYQDIVERLDEESWSGAMQTPAFFHAVEWFGVRRILRKHLSGIRFTDREHEREFWAILDGRRGKQRVFCMATPSNAVRVIE